MYGEEVTITKNITFLQIYLWPTELSSFGTDGNREVRTITPLSSPFVRNHPNYSKAVRNIEYMSYSSNTQLYRFPFILVLEKRNFYMLTTYMDSYFSLMQNLVLKRMGFFNLYYKMTSTAHIAAINILMLWLQVKFAPKKFKERLFKN